MSVQRRPCEQCGHPVDVHGVVSPDHDPMKGGLVLCPVDGCSCYSIWGVNSWPDPPSAEEIARLRTAIQTGEM